MAESGKKNSLSESLECPVCLEYFEKPIRQCLRGHSFCTKCIDPQNIKKCPKCRGDISDTRNYILEEVIDSISLPCHNNGFGCKYMLSRTAMNEHILECQYRKIKCEGKKFCNWTCEWEGQNLLEHFKTKHIRNASLDFTGTVSIVYNSTLNFSDLQLISAHYQLFWYKHKIDINKNTAFWVFQMIGPKKIAAYYYYEFEIFVDASVRKYKVTEFCQSDVEDVEKIFESEKCVAISLKALKNYVNEKNEFSFRFRIMKLKKDDGGVKEKPKEPIKYMTPKMKFIRPKFQKK